MAKKGGKQSVGRNVLKKCGCISKNAHKQPADRLLDELVKCIKEFFDKRYSIKDNFSINDIEPKVKADERLTESQKEDIIIFLDEVSLIYFSGVNRTKEEILKKVKEFVRIVSTLTSTGLKKDKKKKKAESKTKEILNEIRLKPYDKEVKPIMNLIIKAYDLLKKKDLAEAKKVYENIYSKYSILPAKQKNQVYERVRVLEEEIYERYHEKKRIELENLFDHAFRAIKNKKIKEAERKSRKIKDIMGDLPKGIRQKYSNVSSSLNNNLNMAKAEERIEKVNKILDDIYAKGNKYSKTEIMKSYKRAVEVFRLLNNKDKAKMFEVMKEIKRKNDEAYIESVCEKIAHGAIIYWNTHRLNEKRLNKLYDEAYSIYENAEKNQKERFFEILKNSYNMLIETLADKNVKDIEKRLASRNRKKLKHEIMKKYVETKELYDQLPGYKKKKYYHKIFDMYNRIAEL